MQQARGNLKEKSDVCTWKSTECLDGVLTYLWGDGEDPSAVNAQFSALMEWLPPTLQFIHFNAV